MAYVYILTNRYKTVLYTGVTSNLERRLSQHKSLLSPGFTSRYRLTKLVYYREFTFILEAIAMEKHIKGKSRAKKVQLIQSLNPMWENLDCFLSS